MIPLFLWFLHKSKLHSSVEFLKAAVLLFSVLYLCKKHPEISILYLTVVSFIIALSLNHKRTYKMSWEDARFITMVLMIMMTMMMTMMIMTMMMTIMCFLHRTQLIGISDWNAIPMLFARESAWSSCLRAIPEHLFNQACWNLPQLLLQLLRVTHCRAMSCSTTPQTRGLIWACTSVLFDFLQKTSCDSV